MSQFILIVFIGGTIIGALIMALVPKELQINNKDGNATIDYADYRFRILSDQPLEITHDLQNKTVFISRSLSARSD